MSNNYFNSTGTIGFTCDVCGRELQSCSWINGMRFCAKCYQETFGTNTKEITYVYGGNLKEHTKVIEEKDKQIADLEAKLTLAKMNESFEKEKKDNACKFIEQLKQQLAEKDEEIEQWKSMAERSSSMLDRFNYCGESIIYNTTREQDKISFAIAELEKVKDHYRKFKNTSMGIIKRADIVLFIDNQIEEVKKEMK